MKTHIKIALALLTCLVAPGLSHAGSITLDFDNAATGSNIIASPVTSVDGSITASTFDGNLTYSGGGFGGTGGFTGQGLRFAETSAAGYAQLAFDYDVDSVSFLYAGFLGGFFTGQVLDAGLNVLDSFFDGDTTDDLPGGPVTLSGSGIRYFRFFDGPGGGGSVAGVDDVVVTAAVPEPSALILLALGMLSLRSRRASLNLS